MTLDAISFVDHKIFEENKISSKSTKKLSNKHLMDRFLREKNSVKSLLLWLENSHQSFVSSDKKSIQITLLKAINQIDSQLEQQLNKIIHDKKFQALEAAWRGVLYLVNQQQTHDKDQRVKVKILDCSWQVLCKDINKAIEFDQSEFFKLVYNNEYDMAGGEPFGVLIGDYRISHQNSPHKSTNDIDVLKGITRIAAAAFAPFITSVQPSFFGADEFSDLASYIDLSKTFDQIEYINWHSLRAMDDARFLGITLPYVLMRAPYQKDGSRSEGFKFKETITNTDHDYLWGNAAYAFAGVLLRAFSQSGWFSQIRGMQTGQYKKGLVTGLPVCYDETDIYRKANKPAINLFISDRNEKTLSDLGLIPLSHIMGSEYLVFYSNASVQKSAEFDSLSATVNAKLSSMMQYILCVSRFAHYIKVLSREKVGSFASAQLCERDLQTWLHQYTTASDSASDEVRSKYPLQSAQVKVKEMHGKPGHFYSIIQLQPHFQLDQMVSSIKLVTELTPRN